MSTGSIDTDEECCEIHVTTSARSGTVWAGMAYLLKSMLALLFREIAYQFTAMIFCNDISVTEIVSLAVSI